MKIKKNSAILVALFFSSLPFSLCADIENLFKTAPHHSDHIRQGNEWIATYVIDANNKPLLPITDIHLIANLIYFSYQRSKITLDAQDKALQALESLWQGWQNIAQTRRNPSIDLPYSISPEQEINTGELFWQTQHLHRTIGLSYAHALENILKGNALQETLALEGIEEMRRDARIVIAESLLDVEQHLGALFYKAGNKLQNIHEQWEPHTKRTNILDHMWGYISELTTSSFTEADKLNNQISEEGWQTIKAIQEVSKHTWSAIEGARAAFYLAYYHALYNALEKAGINLSEISIMFDNTGVIPEEKRTELLPKPDTLR